MILHKSEANIDTRSLPCMHWQKSSERRFWCPHMNSGITVHKIREVECEQWGIERRARSWKGTDSADISEFTQQDG